MAALQEGSVQLDQASARMRCCGRMLAKGGMKGGRIRITYRFSFLYLHEPLRYYSTPNALNEHKDVATVPNARRSQLSVTARGFMS